MFSYFIEDTVEQSTTKTVRQVNKNEYGLVNQLSYKKKIETLKLLPLEMVYTDSTSLAMADEEEQDTVFIANQESLPSEYMRFFIKTDTVENHYNVSQKSYYFYIKDELKPPPVKVNTDTLSTADNGDLADDLMGEENTDEIIAPSEDTDMVPMEEEQIIAPAED